MTAAHTRRFRCLNNAARRRFPFFPPSPPPRSGAFPAYQTTNNSYLGITCNIAGDLGYTLMTQYDPVNDPSSGAILTYMKGDMVNNGQCMMQFSIVFQCGDFPFPSPVGPYNRYGHFVEQVNVCQYQAFSMSQAGCPQECPITNGAVCSGKGICGYDKNAKTARCFCDDGYMESDCNTPRYPPPAGAIAGATIGGIVLGGAGLFGWTFFAGKRAGAAGGMDGFYGQLN